MKQYSLIIFSAFFLVTLTFAQSGPGCFEIKYLDFFGIKNNGKLKWPSSELDKLLETDFTADGKEKDKKTNFLIPLIVLQLKDHHPACSNSNDTSTYRKLKQLYYKIRQQDIATVNGKPISTQLEMIRQDFYAQVENDSLLPFMSFTFDHGPFYGQLSNFIPNYKQGQVYQMEFGSLYITNYSGRVFITVLNHQSKYLWTRIMTGTGDHFLTEIIFSEKDVIKSSLGYRLRMFSEGEALNLYLKTDGNFRYYFHSW